MAENKIKSKMLKSIAKKYGTPLYVYNADRIIENINRIKLALKGVRYRAFYAVKANSNIHILKIVKSAGFGFECVSGYEVKAAMDAGARGDMIIFDGVGKNYSELDFAVKKNLYFISVESVEELKLIASYNRSIDIALRINPEIDPHTHSKIKTGHAESKFGIDLREIPHLINILKKSRLNLKCIHAHIGSQIFASGKYRELVMKLLEVRDIFLSNGFSVNSIDIGGGFGVHYIQHEKKRPDTHTILKEVVRMLPSDVELIIEPGRSIVADAGVLITKVLYTKKTGGVKYLIVDAGMNDLIRPAMYDAYHEIVSLDKGIDEVVSVAGGVCESSDIFGRNRKLPFKSGIYLAIKNAGAYGYSMSSTYNLRPKPLEVMFYKGSVRVIRKRHLCSGY